MIIGRPAAARRILVVGLTGGIATGKSTVAAMLREHGAVVVDADQVARQIVEPGEPALAEVVRHFGGQMLKADGALDRSALAAVVFADEPARQALNRITHPRIGAEVEREVARLEAAATGPTVVVVEAAVLFEAGWEQRVDLTVATRAEHAQQVSRLMQRYGLNHARAEARVQSQPSAPSAVARADRQIDTSGDLAETRRQAAALWGELFRAAQARFNGAHRAEMMGTGEAWAPTRYTN